MVSSFTENNGIFWVTVECLLSSGIKTHGRRLFSFIDLFPPYFIKLCLNIHPKIPLKCDSHSLNILCINSFENEYYILKYCIFQKYIFRDTRCFGLICLYRLSELNSIFLYEQGQIRSLSGLQTSKLN
jgi:hypothetical protein